MTTPTYTITDAVQDFGVRAELHALIDNAKHAARIHVLDVDAGEAIGNTFYPSMAMALEAFETYRKKMGN